MKSYICAFAAVMALSASMGVTGAMAQTDPPDLSTFANSADIQALIAKARKTIQPGHTILIQKIIGIEPFDAYLDYRAGKGGGGSHNTDDELFYVVEGTGTFVTGGHTVPAPGVNQANAALPNNTIEGGHARTITKGDFFMVPHNTPHQVLAVKGRDMAIIEMRITRPEFVKPQ